MNGRFRHISPSTSPIASRTLATGVLVALLMTSSLGCSRCDGPTMPAEPTAPSTASMDAVDDQLRQMQNEHEQSRKSATPSSSLLGDTGINAEAGDPSEK